MKQKIKAQPVSKIAEILRTIGLTQPRISTLLKGQFRGVSEHRLLECLTKLGRDVQIVIRPIPKSRKNCLPDFPTQTSFNRKRPPPCGVFRHESETGICPAYSPAPALPSQTFMYQHLQ